MYAFSACVVPLFFFFKDMAAGNALSSAVCVVQELVEEEAEPPPDGFKPEVVHAQFTHGDVAQLGRVVHGAEVPRVGHMATVEHVQRVDGQAGIEVPVGKGKEVFRAGHLHARLLLHLACHALLAGLVHVHKAARQIERTLRRVFGAAAHQQLVFPVQDKGYRGRRRIEIIREAAIGTVFRLGVMLLEMRRPALGAISELRKRMFHKQFDTVYVIGTKIGISDVT